MKCLLIIGVSLGLGLAVCAAQEPAATEGFKAGQAFANGTHGKAAAGASVNKDAGAKHVPKFNTAPPEASVYGGGKSFIGSAGLAKQAACSDYVAGSAYEQQECDAVNYLSQQPEKRPRYALDRNNDPLLIGSRSSVDHPGTASPGGAAACYLVTTTIPATLATETCERSASIDNLACTKTLLPVCGYKGSAIRNYKAERTGAFVSAAMTAGRAEGLYDFLLEVPYRNCGGEGSAQLDFTLDSVGEGGYITIQINNLDDAAAVAVNGTTLLAGYPNSGPYYSADVFPTSRMDFQLGYSWDEDVGGERCVAWNSAGTCVGSAHIPDVRRFRADTKLLDSCPAGYVPLKQEAGDGCTAAGSACTDGSGDTAMTHPGFFCNAQGKFILNRHEGYGTWAGSVSSAIPLRVGVNNVTVFWATARAKEACGNVRVSGQVYNVAAACSTAWDDQCAPMRAAVAK